MAGIQLTLKRRGINRRFGESGEGMSRVPRKLAASSLPYEADALMLNLLGALEDVMNNAQTLCHSCNASRGNSMPEVK